MLHKSQGMPQPANLRVVLTRGGVRLCLRLTEADSQHCRCAACHTGRRSSLCLAGKGSSWREGIIMMKWLTFHLSRTLADGVLHSPMSLFKCQLDGGMLSDDVNGCCKGRGILADVDVPWSSFALSSTTCRLSVETHWVCVCDSVLY